MDMGIFGADIPAYTPEQASTTGAGNPASMGGVPTIMPTNDWWKNVGDFATQTAKNVTDIAIARAKSGIATPTGTVSSNIQNPAPGSRGLWFQNKSTPGADAVGQIPGPLSGNGAMIVAGLVVLVVVVVMLGRS